LVALVTSGRNVKRASSPVVPHAEAAEERGGENFGLRIADWGLGNPKF
jgi:hypothetical protein